MDYQSICALIHMECSLIQMSFGGVGGDGRLDSAQSEGTYLDILVPNLQKHGLRVCKQPKPRYWWDFEVEGIPINLKITTGTTADNACNKKAIILTKNTCLPVKDSMNWNTFYTQFQKCEYRDTRDIAKEYHYLVVRKDDCSFLFKSILDISTFYSNPSNILQIKWSQEFLNRDYKCVCHVHKLKEILHTIQKSLRDRKDDLLMNAEL